MKAKQNLSEKQSLEFIELLHARFQKNPHRHSGIKWEDVAVRLKKQPEKLWSLFQMESTGGEPDCISYDKKSNTYLFVDCSPESPAGRRSLCYDGAALAARKENKPRGSAMGMATEMGIDMLTETEYRSLKAIEPFDQKTSSWIKTPDSIRQLGGALFADFRFNHVFVYHNGVQSYYAARGFRGSIAI